MNCLAAEYHVSPEGSDQNPGTKDKPFATLAAARDAVRKSAGEAGGDSVVYLHGGQFRLSQAIGFGPEDSGKPNAKIIYRAYGDEKPVLSGGEIVRGWELHDAARNIYKANVGKEPFHQVYINGEMAIRSRYPHGTPVDGPYLRMEDGDGRNHRIQIKAADWKAVGANIDPKTLEIVYLLHWTEFRGKCKDVSEDGDKVWFTIDAPDPKAFFVKPDKWFPNQPYCFENALGFVSEDGEWFHDPSTGWLYLKVAKNIDIKKAVVEIPRLSTLIDISGTPENPVHDLEFQGLGIELSNWTRPSEKGLPATQFVQPYDVSLKQRTYDNLDWPQGMIKVRHATRLGIRNCRIHNAGATGIQFWMHVTDSDIEGNEIFSIAANGIEIDPQNDSRPKPEEQSVHVSIWNNNIHHTGQNYTNGGAVLAHFVKDLIFDHNEVHDLPYGGIQVGNQPHPKGTDNGCHDNKIRCNNFYRCMLLHDDSGAIYTLGADQTGTEITENYVHDIKRSKWAGTYYVAAIYLDNFTRFVTCARNVIQRTDNHTPYGQFNGSTENTFTDNDGSDEKVIANAGILKGYNPHHSRNETH